MSVYLIILDYLVPLAEVDAQLEAHRAWVDRGFADGVFLLSGPCIPREGGAIVAHGEDRAAIEARVAADPFHTAQVARHRIVEVAARRADPRLSFLLGD
jgi:uncharacterized protein YciI